MPISLRGAKDLKDLSNMDFRVLNMIETLLRKGEYAPVEKIVTYSGYRAKDVDLILSKLNTKEFSTEVFASFNSSSVTG